VSGKKNKSGHVVEVGNVYEDNDPRANLKRELVVLSFEKDAVHGERAVLRVDVAGQSTGRRARIKIDRLGTEAKGGYKQIGARTT